MNSTRRYIRHPANIPIQVGRQAGGEERPPTAYDISHGGLAFRADRCFGSGEIISLSLPTVEPPFELEARVAWCRPVNGDFQVGVEFLGASDAFRARMVEQVCHIEEYQRKVEKEEGRKLSGDEAAQEWIAKFGDRFPATAE